jgi:alkaline phosphatase D
MKYLLIISVATILFATSCTKQNQFSANFDNTNNRIWVGKDFWSIPLEDWKVEDGKLFCTGEVPNSRVNLLTHVISPEAGDFQVSAKIMLTEKSDVPGSAGFLIGAHDNEDPDVRAACYFGGGIKAGVSLNGFAFLKDEKVDLPEGFDFSDFNISSAEMITHLIKNYR